MEARRLRKVISKLREMIEDKAEDLKKVVSDNFSHRNANCWNIMNRALLEVDAIAESLIYMSLDTVQYGDVPGDSEDVQDDEVDDHDFHDPVNSVVDRPEYGEGTDTEGSDTGGSDCSFESDRSWHLTYV